MIGYGIFFSLWVWFADGFEQTLSNSTLGQRLLDGFADLGSASVFALVTFGAAMTGSIAWKLVFRRIARWLQRVTKHPDWERLVFDAGEVVKDYEENVLDSVGQDHTFSHPTATLPSMHYGEILMEQRVTRQKRGADVDFRMSLAIALVLVSITLICAGSEWWWWVSLVGVFASLLDVAMIKHATEFELLDDNLRDRLPQLLSSLRHAKRYAGEGGEDYFKGIDSAREIIQTLEVLLRHRRRPSSRLFRFIEGTTRLPPDVSERINEAIPLIREFSLDASDFWASSDGGPLPTE